MHLSGWFLRCQVFVLIKIGCELEIVLYVLPALSIVCLIITYLIAVKKYGRFRLILSLSFLSHTLRDAIPYVLSVLLRRLMTRMDVIFLGFFYWFKCCWSIQRRVSCSISSFFSSSFYWNNIASYSIKTLRQLTGGTCWTFTINRLVLFVLSGYPQRQESGW